MPRPGSVLPLLLLATCAAPAAPPPLPPPARNVMVAMPLGVRLLVEPAIAAPGDEVTLELLNARRDRVGFNLCSSALARLEDGQRIDVQQPGTCTRELRIVEPGGTARYAKRLPADLAPGRYSYSTRIQAPLHGQQHPLLFSDPFEVR